ncbi:MAG TPA: T9SS type A sorting domain-containing protein [Bacteroidales bacterium]
MKNIITIISMLFLSGIVFGQGAVAVDDTASVSLGQYVTVNVLANDYHPDGKSFKIKSATYAYSFTDSSITYFTNYDQFYNINGNFKRGTYMLIDEDGLIGPNSIGTVYLDILNTDFRTYLDANNIKAGINAWGGQFWQGVGSSDPIMFEYPKGSGKNTIFNQTLWVGGMDQNELKLAAERFRQVGTDFWTGPLSIDGNNLSIDTATIVSWNKVWKLNVDEIIYHRTHWSDPGYEPIDNIKNWPAQGDPELNQSEYLAPFVDVDGDGNYDPYSGDYPLIRGDQCVFFIFNDLKVHGETGAGTIGLEIHGMAYEFYAPDSVAMNNTVFLSYKIFNRSSNLLEDTYIGLFCDFDIGYARDDYVGCDVARGAYYGYNGDDFDDEPEGYGENPPAQGIVILGGPYLNPNNEDDPNGGCDESITGVGFGDGIVDNERYGMTKFIYFNNSGNTQGDPQIATHYYDYMNSIWKDGTAMEYGGNGHVSSGAYGPACNFMFPGMTDPCYWGTNGEEPYGPVDWTEEIAGNEPEDRRGLSVMGPFTFQPNSMQKVDFAFVTARGDDGPLSSVELLKTYIDDVKEAYYRNSDYFGYQWLGEEENVAEVQQLRIYPNPAIDEIWVNYNNQSSVQYAIFDTYGRMVKQGELSGIGSNKIPISELKGGMYIIRITDKNKGYTSKFLKK